MTVLLRNKIFQLTGFSYVKLFKTAIVVNGTTLMKIYFSCRKCKSKCLVIVDLKLKIANIYSNNAVHNHASIKRVKQYKLNVMIFFYYFKKLNFNILLKTKVFIR